jgi:hypothetical protein
MGFGQVLSHADGQKHKEAMLSRKCQSFFKIKRSNACADGNVNESSRVHSVDQDSEIVNGTSTCQVTLEKKNASNTLWLPIGLDDKVCKAETVLLLKLIESNYSFASFDNIAEVLKLAFVDSDIAQHLKLCATKVSYSICYGLGPYFHDSFVKEIKLGAVKFFTICFDETTNRQVKKQMDLHVRYWSDKFGKVIVVYLDSAFLGHATAVTVEEVIVRFFNESGLSYHHLLQCSMDGPCC